MKEATKYEIKECSSIISSYLENIPAYICRDRKGKATALLALAYKISQNKEKEGDGIDYGKLGLGAAAAVTIGAIFPPSLGIIGGGLIGRGLIGVLGATVGKLIKDSSVENPSENAIQKLSRDKWDYLTTYSEASLNAIADRITDTLYPKRLNDVDIRMLLSLADVSPFDAIETINCDLGIIYEIESLTDNTCISDDSCSSEIEKAITGLTQKPGRRSGSKVKFLMTERLKLDDNTYALNTQAINYMAEMCGMVSQLEPGQTLIATAPRHFLYSPGFQKIRKALFANGHLKAIMPLKQPVIYGGMDFVAMVFTGDVSKKL